MSAPYCDCGEHYEGYQEGIALGASEIVTWLDDNLADDYLAIFEHTTGNTKNISKADLLKLITEFGDELSSADGE